MSPLTRIISSRDRCMAVAVCIGIIFQSVHVSIENVNASYIHLICMEFYQVYGACSLVTFKGGLWDGMGLLMHKTYALQKESLFYLTIPLERNNFYIISYWTSSV